MRVPIAVVVGASLALLNSGCSSTFGCDPPSKKFSLDEDLTPGDVASIVNDWGLSGPDAIECETACTYMFRQTDGWETREIDSCTHDIDPSATQDPAGHVTCSGAAIEYYCEGRRPLGWEAETDLDPTTPVEQLVALARLEAVSIRSFEQLAERLAGWGAPADLVRRCSRAAEDERRHRDAVLVLARRRGWTGAPRVEAYGEQACEHAHGDLLAEAMHNAVEGCVAETWAALLAHVRAQRAADADVRAGYAEIAADETRHAQLAWDLHVWFCARSSPAERARIEASRTEALRQLPRRAARLAAAMAPALSGTTPNEAAWLARDYAQRLLQAG